MFVSLAIVFKNCNLTLFECHRFDGGAGNFKAFHQSAAMQLCRFITCQNIGDSADSSSNGTRSRLAKLMADVKDIAEEDLSMLRRSSDVVIGMRIIQQFVIDLLGRNTPAAMIFQTKTEAE